MENNTPNPNPAEVDKPNQFMKPNYNQIRPQNENHFESLNKPTTSEVDFNFADFESGEPIKVEKKRSSVFSNYANCKSTTPLGNSSLREFIEIIKSPRYQQPVEDIRKADSDKRDKDANDLKEKLPGSSLSVCGSRKKGVERDHTGYLQIDLDVKSNPEVDLQAIIPELKLDPYVLAIFTSPRYGLKLVVKIEPSEDSHKKSFASAERYFKNRYNLTMDAATKDATRLCFVSHDPDAWIVEDESKVTCVPISEDEPKSEKPTKLPINRPSKVISAPVGLSDGDAKIDQAIQNQKLQKEFEVKHPALATLYDDLVRAKTVDFQKKTRHNESLKLINALFCAVSKANLLIFMEQFWMENKSNIETSFNDHMNECQMQLENVERLYLEQLPKKDRELYDAYDSNMKTAFRICQALASLKENQKSGSFFLSGDHLEKRISQKSKFNKSKGQGNRRLKYLTRDGVIALIENGTQGTNGKASVYKFLRATV